MPRSIRKPSSNLVVDVSNRLQGKYDLSYKTTCHLRTQFHRLMELGMRAEDAEQMLNDLFENLAFKQYAPAIIPGRGITPVRLAFEEL